MKKLLSVLLCLMLVLGCAACGEEEEVVMNTDQVSAEGQAGQALNESQPQATDFESVTDYMHNYKRLEGSLVRVPGILVEYDQEKKLLDIEDDSYLTVELDSSYAPDGYEEIEKNSYIIITGTSEVDQNGNPVIQIQGYEAVEGLKEPYWSDTTLITDENVLSVMSAGCDPSEYFECTAILTPSNVLIILGLSDLPHVQRGNFYFVNIPYNEPLQMLITDIHYDSDERLQFNIEEVVQFS